MIFALLIFGFHVKPKPIVRQRRKATGLSKTGVAELRDSRVAMIGVIRFFIAETNKERGGYIENNQKI